MVTVLRSVLIDVYEVYPRTQPHEYGANNHAYQIAVRQPDRYQSYERSDGEVQARISRFTDEPDQRESLKEEQHAKYGQWKRPHHVIEPRSEDKPQRDENQAVNDDRPAGTAAECVVAGHATGAMARRYSAQPWTDQVHSGVRDANFADGQIALGKEIVRQLARGKNGVAQRQGDLGQREQHKPGSYVRQLRYMRSRQVQPDACYQRAWVESVRRDRESKGHHRQSGRQPAIPQEQHDDDKREAGEEVTRHALRTNIVLQGDRSELQAQPKLDAAHHAFGNDARQPRERAR